MRSSPCPTTTATTTTADGSGGNNTSSHTSNSSSSSSHPPPPLTTILTNLTTTNLLIPTPRRTMEEVWKDISLTSLQDHHPHHHHSHHHHHHHNNNNQISTQLSGPHHLHNLQDFLARPFTSKDPSTTSTTSTGDFGAAAFASPPPPPATALCLNSRPPHHQFHYQGQLEMDQSQVHHNVDVASSLVATLNNSAFDAFGSSSALSSLCRKRVSDDQSKENTGDRRHKRMIKNRESAARSRARKQECISSTSLKHYKLIAYTNELELEVAHLMEENAKLRKQQQQLYMAAAAQLPKKHTLQRTSTAPF
ncbi:hypothetical protein Sjap_009903 [Stephania japonica]|uniref:BZIP domain-containing protein n=1 Tax=Stephania japonica TaxID=461633 RepID=A0AAP0P6M9_9MAGN